MLLFALPAPTSVLGLPIGQHISCRGKDNLGEEVIKPYIPTTLDSDLGYFELVIKMYPQGRMSHHFREMKVGDYLSVKGPKNMCLRPLLQLQDLLLQLQDLLVCQLQDLLHQLQDLRFSSCRIFDSPAAGSPSPVAESIVERDDTQDERYARVDNVDKGKGWIN